MAACATRVSASFPAMATGYPQGAATLPTRLEHDHASNHQITACPSAQRARLLPGPAREHVDHRPRPPAARTPPRPQCRRPGPCWPLRHRILKTHRRARRDAQTHAAPIRAIRRGALRHAPWCQGGARLSRERFYGCRMDLPTVARHTRWPCGRWGRPRQCRVPSGCQIKGICAAHHRYTADLPNHRIGSIPAAWLPRFDVTIRN